MIASGRDVYSLLNERSLLNGILLKKREEIFARLNSRVDFSSLSSVLDVGVTADRIRQNSNFFEALYPNKAQITALSDQDASWMEEIYPGLKFVRGDGRNMPFGEKEFDLVFSSAVIEHVGGLENQRRFLFECCRVSKRYVFVTTPNRWHPVEFHTVLPFIHWLPKKAHRGVLRFLGKFSRNRYINDLAKGE